MGKGGLSLSRRMLLGAVGVAAPGTARDAEAERPKRPGYVWVEVPEAAWAALVEAGRMLDGLRPR